MTAEHKHYIERYHSARATANTVRVPVQRHITTQQPMTDGIATSRVVQRPIATRVPQQRPMRQQIILDPQNLTKQKVFRNVCIHSFMRQNKTIYIIIDMPRIFF